MVIVPLPWTISNTVPSPDAPPSDVVPKRLPLESSITPACGICAVGSIERGERGDRTAPLDNLEHRAVSDAPP